MIDLYNTSQYLKKHWVDLIALMLILFFLVFNYFSMQNVFRTKDETEHFTYGANILELNSNRLIDKAGIVDDSKMPISALNALPAKIARKYLRMGSLKNFLRDFLAARLVTVIFSGCVALLVFHWSRSLYGGIPALASLFLYVFDPNIIAHSQLVTTDIYAMGLIAFSFYWLWRFAKERNLKNGLLFSLFLGISQIAKYTSIVILPLAILALIAHDWLPWKRDTSFVKSSGSYMIKLLLYVLIAVLICVAVINLGYLFNRSFLHLKEYHFESDKLQYLQSHLPILGNLPIPTPYPYLQGLDLVLFRESTGFGYGNIYLLGMLHGVEGFNGYYFVASLLKIPIATQVILLSTVFIYFQDKTRRSRFWADEVFLLIPVVFFTLYFNFFYNAQLGIRFYLVVFPLLYVFTGQLFRNFENLTRRQKTTVYILSVYLAVSVFSYYPHYIAYFNEIIWDRKMAYKYLADSNLDWRQGKGYLDKYLKDHPDAIYSPGDIQAGEIIVPATDLVGVTVGSEYYAWLRENFEPVGTIAYSYLVYNVSQEDLDHLCETKSICSSQP